MKWNELGTRKKLSRFLGLAQTTDISLEDGELLQQLMSKVQPTIYTRDRGECRFETTHHITGEIIVGVADTHIVPALEQFLSNWFVQDGLARTTAPA